MALTFKVLMKGTEFAYIEVSDNGFNIGTTDVPDLFPSDLTTQDLIDKFLLLLGNSVTGDAELQETLSDMELREVSLEFINS